MFHYAVLGLGPRPPVKKNSVIIRSHDDSESTVPRIRASSLVNRGELVRRCSFGQANPWVGRVYTGDQNVARRGSYRSGRLRLGMHRGRRAENGCSFPIGQHEL